MHWCRYQISTTTVKTLCKAWCRRGQPWFCGKSGTKTNNILLFGKFCSNVSFFSFQNCAWLLALIFNLKGLQCFDKWVCWANWPYLQLIKWDVILTSSLAQESVLSWLIISAIPWHSCFFKIPRLKWGEVKSITLLKMYEMGSKNFILS